MSTKRLSLLLDKRKLIDQNNKTVDIETRSSQRSFSNKEKEILRRSKLMNTPSARGKKANKAEPKVNKIGKLLELA